MEVQLFVSKFMVFALISKYFRNTCKLSDGFNLLVAYEYTVSASESVSADNFTKGTLVSEVSKSGIGTPLVWNTNLVPL